MLLPWASITCGAGRRPESGEGALIPRAGNRTGPGRAARPDDPAAAPARGGPGEAGGRGHPPHRGRGAPPRSRCGPLFGCGFWTARGSRRGDIGRIGNRCQFAGVHHLGGLQREDDTGYLLRVLRNTFFSQRRSAARRPQTAPLPDALDLLEDPRAPQPEARIAAAELYAAISALPADFRDTLIAIDVVGLSYREAARTLRVREATITTRLHRARQRVTRWIAAQEEPDAPSDARDASR